MAAETHEITFEGSALERGFWLYVWEITPPDSRPIYYIGRTGDSSSTNAQSPFNRVGQHLGFNKRSDALRRHLKKNGTVAEECRFRFVAHGPILPEANTLDEHRESRDIVAGLEKALCNWFSASGKKVLNVVHCRRPVDEARFGEIRAAFSILIGDSPDQ